MAVPEGFQNLRRCLWELLLVVLIMQAVGTLVVSVAAAEKHQTHKPEAHKQRKHDAENPRKPAVAAHFSSGGLLPSPDRPTDREAEECERIGRDPGHRERSGPAFCYVTDDPERAWEQVGPYVLYHLHAYGVWSRNDQDRESKVFPPAATIDDLKRDPAYQVVTPDECVALASRWHPDGALLLHPLMAALPPELSWPSLELFEHEVLPRLG